MDFSTKYTVRTDLADEVLEGLYGKQKNKSEGIIVKNSKIQGFQVDEVIVEDENASKIVSKPVGRYVTVETGEIWKADSGEFERAARVISGVIKQMLPKEGLYLVVCLGNDRIIADAVGPYCAKKLIVSRHLKEHNQELFNSLQLGECACIIPGVMGNTGAEAAEIIKGVVDMLKPSAVIAVDALASRKLSRLARTIQICDTGISPGSGVGNSRSEISYRTLGVPTVAVGVPTVVEAGTLCLDILEGVLENQQEVINIVQERLSQNPSGFYVAPKETDRIIESTARLLGYALNFTFHTEDMTISEMDEFLA